jgi:PAS domain S-box-containing protein
MNEPLLNANAVNGAGTTSKTLIQSFGDFFPAVIFNYDTDRKEVTYVNSKLKDILGVSPDEFENLSSKLPDLVFHEDLRSFEQSLQKFESIKEGDSFEFVTRFNHRQGGCRYLKCSASRYNSSAVMIACLDITDQVRHEEEAVAIRQLFDETEKLLLFGTWSWAPSATTVEWTEGMWKLLGYEQHEVPEVTNEFFLKHVLPEHLDSLQRVVSKALDAKEGFEHEYVVRTKTGVEKFVYTKGRALLNKDGDLKRIIGITRDITAKKNFENERDRNIRELNRSNKELEEFAYVASHDLHEPLRKILTFSERLKGKFSEALGEDGSTYLSRIWASADNMRKLIDNLLEFSKISKGTRSFVSCSLSDVLKDVVSDQELRIEETSTVLKVKDLPVVEGVPSELRQLFNNLISNALKFRKKDVAPVITITSHTLSHKEKSEMLLPFNQVFYQINVQDNGIGFESVYAEKIFEIFQRLHGKAEYSGSGIGLAICKKIVDNHDGIIYAKGEPGIGSVFSVILPQKQLS